MYGLISRQYLIDCINNVCNTIGTNSTNAKKLLFETCAAETNLGQTPDLTPDSDYGIFQFTKTGLNAVKTVSTSIKTKIKNTYGVDIDTLSVTDLRYSVLASTICARLYYLTISENIPSTVTGRAEYWKKYYNSSLGSGTVTGYINAQKDNPLPQELKG